MRRGIQALAPLVIGTLIVSGNAAIAAVKAGSACPKAGATSTIAGKKFTCIKSGTRLVWNKGVAIKAAAKPTPTATAVPTESSKPTLRQVWGSVSSDSLAVWDIIKPISSDLKGSGLKNITFAFSSDIPADSQEELKRQYRLTTTYWARFTKSVAVFRTSERICGAFSASSATSR